MSPLESDTSTCDSFARMSRKPLRALIFGVLALFSLWCVVSLRADLKQISLTRVLRAWDMLLAATGLSLLNYGLRIVRWRAYLAYLGHPVPKGFAALTYIAGFAFTLSPGKLGEVIRARYYTTRDIPLSTVTGVFFMERLTDLLAICALAATMLISLPQYTVYIVTALVLVGGILIALMMMPWQTVRGGLNAIQPLPEKIKKAGRGVAMMMMGARSLLTLWSLTVGFLLGLAAWAAEGLGFGILSSIDPLASLGWLSAMGIYSVAILVGALSFLPGGLGSTEAVMTTLLVAHKYALTDALLVTLACRLVTLWFAIALGWIAVWTLRRQGASRSS